jgi:hypothetical protein
MAEDIAAMGPLAVGAVKRIVKKGEGVDLMHLIHAVKQEALWITLAVAAVCVLYFVAMRLTEARKG